MSIKQIERELARVQARAEKAESLAQEIQQIVAVVLDHLRHCAVPVGTHAGNGKAVAQAN